jgi:hypothetical protein
MKRRDRRPFAAVLALLAGACFDGGGYEGGGRRFEAPGMLDAAPDFLDDGPTAHDATSDEDADASADEGVGVIDASLDLAREPPPGVEDAAGYEAEAGPFDVTTEGPSSGHDAGEPRDAAPDLPDSPLRDAPADLRRD